MAERRLDAFLVARIGEDEALALAAIADDCGQDVGFKDAYPRLTGVGPLAFIPRFGDAAARMIVWNTPRRVLAECTAKRAIIAEHAHGLETSGCCDGCEPVEYWEYWECETCSDNGGWCRTLRLLAAVYDWHPDYQEGWRP